MMRYGSPKRTRNTLSGIFDPGDGVFSCNPNSSSNVCRNGQKNVVKVTPSISFFFCFFAWNHTTVETQGNTRVQ